MDEEVKGSKDEVILKAKELYSKGSRNFLLKCYTDAADELSQACALYEEIYGELSDELGMPYLLYAKALMALALDENKVIDVPDEDEDEDEEGDDDENNEETNEEANGKNLETVETENQNKLNEEKDVAKSSGNGADNETAQPSTSNDLAEPTEDEESEAASNLQLAWEILELAAKIFTRQGLSGLSNLAEVQTELANIAFENNNLDYAREDYGKALKIYDEFVVKDRRAMAEIHYKIGLSYLMQQMNQEGAESLKASCDLIDDEINSIKSEPNPNNELMKDLEETKQEILIKIVEIKETREQNNAEVRAALDSYAGLNKTKTTDSTAPSSSDANTSVKSNSEPKNINHLIKRKKPDTPPNSEAEAASPAKKSVI